MEEAKAGKVWSLNLPIGFRFHPTDEELLVHYLSRKIFSMPLPAFIIPEVANVFSSFPCDLPGDSRDKRYFFSKTNGDINSRLISGRNSGGYWKAIGQNQLIVGTTESETGISHHQQQLVVGTKKALRFYQAKHSECLKTHWFMHQYSLVTTTHNPTTSQNVNSMSQLGNWSIFCIYQKKLQVISKNRRANKAEQCIKASRPPPTSPSSNSVVTDISSNQSLELDQEVTSCHFRF